MSLNVVFSVKVYNYKMLFVFHETLVPVNDKNYWH